jgi:hypothetical protein
MEPSAKTAAKIAALNKEMDAIYYANKLYWQNLNPTLAARSEYNLRNERLEEIRDELAKLSAPRAKSVTG